MSVEIDPFATTSMSIRSAALGRDIKFRVRIPTRKLRKDNDRLCDEARKQIDKEKPDKEQLWSIIKSGVEAGAVGWDEPEPFSFEAIESKLDNFEIIRLFREWPHAAHLTEDDKGKSQSPPVATSA